VVPLTIFATALSQQPKIRRALLPEIADYNSNAEARAFTQEVARAAATSAASAASFGSTDPSQVATKYTDEDIRTKMQHFSGRNLSLESIRSRYGRAETPRRSAPEPRPRGPALHGTWRHSLA